MLVSVYEKENPLYLDESLKSIFSQTYPAEQVVLVCDGRLTNELDSVVSRYEREYPQIFEAVRLPENVGPGDAANRGNAVAFLDEKSLYKRDYYQDRQR